MKDLNEEHRIQKLLGETNNSVLISLLLSFLGVWCLMFDFIINKTGESCDRERLISYCMIHFIVTIVICLILFAYYARGRFVIDKDPLLLFVKAIKVREFYIDILRASTRVIYIYWLPLLLLCLFIFLLSFYSSDFITFLNVFITLLSLYWIVVRKNQEDISLSSPLIFIVCFFILFFTFCVVVSLDIDVTTDKPNYQPKDQIVITLTPRGYVISPDIQYIIYLDDDKKIIKAFEGKNILKVKK